ncbi:hypothetical protein OKW41_006972 [Paraburkholderia sp. UCT70]|uniref:hypothetical protein n=1 Tax=Paraburkholderia sp. UCT70 TaxID=2991068 RepID=UPI003D200D6D
MSNSTTLIDQISSTQATKEVVANANFDAASPAMLWGRRASTTSGLTWGYYGGSYTVGITVNSIINGTLTLTASATNYVQANVNTGAVSVNTTGFTAGAVPLYQIVTGASAVTSYSDCRSFATSAATGTVTSVGGTGGVETDQGTPESESSDNTAITSSGKIRTVVKLAGAAVQTAAYTFASSDRSACLVMNSSSAVSQSLPAASGTSGSFPAGWWGSVQNIGTGAMSLGVPSGARLDGTTNGSVTLATGTGLMYFTDGTNWYTMRGAASGGGGSGGMTNPMTTAGDLISAAAGGAPQRVAAGSSGQVLTMLGGQPAWAAASGSTGDPINFSAANHYSGSGFTLTQYNTTGAALSALASGRGFQINVPNTTASSDNVLHALQNVPTSSSWSVTTLLNFNNGGGYLSSGSYSSAQLIITDTTGKLVAFGWDPAGSGASPNNLYLDMTYSVWTSISSFSSRMALDAMHPQGVPVWLKVTYTGSGGNFVFYTSVDGETWVQRYSVAASTLGTLAQCGFRVDANNRGSVGTANQVVALTCFHYAQG